MCACILQGGCCLDRGLRESCCIHRHEKWVLELPGLEPMQGRAVLLSWAPAAVARARHLEKAVWMWALPWVCAQLWAALEHEALLFWTYMRQQASLVFTGADLHHGKGVPMDCCSGPRTSMPAEGLSCCTLTCAHWGVLRLWLPTRTWPKRGPWLKLQNGCVVCTCRGTRSLKVQPLLGSRAQWQDRASMQGDLVLC